MAVSSNQAGETCSRKTPISRLSRTTNPAAIAEQLWEREDPSAARMKEGYESLLKREQAYVKGELEPFLEYNDMTELRKKENLHKKWAEQVAEPIRREIDKQMHSRRLPALERRRQQLYNDYLTHVNRKGHVFLDVIAPDEYYAMALQDMQPYLLMAKTKRLRDPTLAQYRSRIDEDRVEMRCLSGSFLTDKEIEQIRLPPVPLVPLGREGVNAISWVRMPLVDIDSNERHASRHRMHSSGTRSSIDFGAWSRTPLSRSIVDAELQLQKKRHFPHPHAPRPQVPTRQPRPHPPRYEPRSQAEPSAVEPQPAVVEPQPSAVEPVAEPQPSMVEPGPPVQYAQPKPEPQHTHAPQPPMEKLQAQLSVPEPQPKPIAFVPQPHIYTHESQPHAVAPVQSALVPSNSYIIAC